MEQDLVGQAQAVAEVITGRRAAWLTQQPSSNEAAWAEIVRYAFEAVRACSAKA
ncbi:hypothetical protein ACWEQL_04610 [Kitasatospora sp. NPDC004240]